MLVGATLKDAASVYMPLLGLEILPFARFIKVGIKISAVSTAGGKTPMPGQTGFSKHDLVFRIIFLSLNYLRLLTNLLIHFHVPWT